MAKMCRTCARIMVNEFFYLDGSSFASNTLEVKDVLIACIPEFDLDIDPNAALCRNCMSSLHIAYYFITETLKNEETFRSKQHIRIKHLDVLTGKHISTDSNSSGEIKPDRASQIIELESEDLDALKTELVYEDDITDQIKIAPEIIEPFLNDDSCLVNNQTEEMVEDQKEVTQIEPKTKVVSAFIENLGVIRKKRDIKRPYKCSECNFRSDAKASLIMHKRIHTGEKPFHCTKCNYQAKRKSHLQGHMKVHTGDRPFKCILCDRSFTTKEKLAKHSQIHTGEKQYRCRQCNFRTRHKLSITNHVKRIHIGVPKLQQDQQIICYICGKRLSGTSTLRSHMRIHTGVKSYLCERCGRYFREKSMLKNHMRVHLGEKPFKCTDCDYISMRKAPLQRHLKMHVGHIDLVSCTLCSKRYLNNALVKNHMKQDHHVKSEKSVEVVFIDSTE